MMGVITGFASPSNFNKAAMALEFFTGFWPELLLGATANGALGIFAGSNVGFIFAFSGWIEPGACD
jgi:hypothetical protein